MREEKGTRDPIWNVLREHSKAKLDADRKRFLAEAVQKDDGSWTKHTQYHWSRMVNGQRLNYWPSRKKYQYQGEVRRGDVMSFIRKQEKKK